MKRFNFQLGIILLMLLVCNVGMAEQKEPNKKGEEVIITKNGNERVEITTLKDRTKIVKVIVDGDVVLGGDEIVEELDLAFEELEVKLNKIYIPNIRFNVAEDGEINDDEGELGVSLRETKTKTNEDGETVKQVKITAVCEKSAAEEAGLQKGDIITEIEGKKVKSLSQMMHLIKANAAGETITIQYIRDGETKETQATLKASENKNMLIFGNNDTRIEWNDDGGINWKGDENFTIKFPMFENKGEMGVTLGDADENGVNIKQIEEEGGAAAAGLQEGDIITEVEGQIVTSLNDFMIALDGKKANETVDVNYTRDGEVNNTTVTLKKSNNIFLFKGEDQEIKWEGNVNDWNFNWLEDNGNASMGVILGEETENGVAIEGTVNNSGAEEAGLKSGDVITAIDGETVKTGTELKAILKEKKAGDNVEVTYLRGEETKTVNIALGSKNFRIRKPRDIDILFGDNNRNEEMEVYEDVEIPKVTAENRLEFTQLDMYPNPNKGAFTLAFEIEPGTAIITIKNVDDEVVYTKDMPNFNGVFSDRIDISEQPSGVYFLTIEQGGKKVIKKVIYD